MRGVLTGFLEDVGALDTVRIREGRIGRGGFERGIFMEMALWAKVIIFLEAGEVWRRGLQRMSFMYLLVN